MATEDDERIEELASLQAIYPELVIDENDPFTAILELAVTPSQPLMIRFVPDTSITPPGDSYARVAANGHAYIEHDIGLSHLPPLSLRLSLPKDYPNDSPPKTSLSTAEDWLPTQRLRELETEAGKLWEEYGRCQILFAYIDHLQQVIENGFDLSSTSDGCLVLSSSKEPSLVHFNETTELATFNAGTYDCGICLEPKKGSSCYRMKRCSHVFCRQCLQDFYNNAITEGDIAGVRCLDPTCGKESNTPAREKPKRKKERTLHPRELLAMGIEDTKVRRYVELKRKKKLEADKTTVYCPRTWCQGPARSPKYPPIPADLSTYIDIDSSAEDNDGAESRGSKIPADPGDRLAVCEKCSLAFCRVCYMGWHGPFARCYPRDPNELSAEEKASYDYIRKNTSPCPTCGSPTQKTMGCNHMKCFQCNSHFCYLCGAWLIADNPYQHYNTQGSECFQRLWELEEGDEGQAPGDGRGFAGERRWEQLALEAAREADAAEAAAAEGDQAVPDPIPRHLQVDGAGLDVPQGVIMGGLPIDNDMIEQAIHHIMMDRDVNQRRHLAQQPVEQPAQGGRRRYNPHPRIAPGRGGAQAVRNHERNRRGGRANGNGQQRPPPMDEDERQQQELQRFLDMAQRDEEDGWNSDDLHEDDDRFDIR